MSATSPSLPARYDHVGSFLRPKFLLEAREKKSKGEISAAELRAVEDKAIADINSHLAHKEKDLLTV